MSRAEDIVESLLGLTEDLQAKIPVLLRQFPNFTEQEINEFAQADPTSPARAEYITWICRMRRDGMWDGVGVGDFANMRDLLTRYHAVKKKPRFTQVNGKTDINQYNTVVELRQHVDAALKEDWDAAAAKAGTEVLNKIGPLLLLKITNFDAAKKVAIEPGQAAPDNADFNDINQHAGTGEPGWPYACWCTQRASHYPSYSNGPLYTIKKGKFPYAQISFAHPQMRDIKNQTISPDVTEEIKPLFLVPEFAFIGGTRLIDEAKLKNKCLTMIKGTISRALNGYIKQDGTHVDPTATDRAAVIQSLIPKVPRFYGLFVEIAKNWNHPVDTRDELIKREIKADNRGRSYGEAEPLAAYIRENLAAETVPPVLQSLEAFTAMFTELLDNV